MAQALAALLPARKPSPQARISAGLIARILPCRQRRRQIERLPRSCASVCRSSPTSTCNSTSSMRNCRVSSARLRLAASRSGTFFANPRLPRPLREVRAPSRIRGLGPEITHGRHAQRFTLSTERPFAIGLLRAYLTGTDRSWDSNARERLVAFFALSLSPLSRSSRPSWVHADESSGARLTGSRAPAIASASRPSAQSGALAHRRQRQRRWRRSARSALPAHGRPTSWRRPTCGLAI